MEKHAHSPPCQKREHAQTDRCAQTMILRMRTHSFAHSHIFLSLHCSLQATAGLRSVTPAEAHAVLEVVRDDLSQSGFLFERSWAKIISGEQEGINGWMAVNYLLGVFDEPIAAGAPAPISTGVVEMGGSSMQITFAPSAPSADDRKQLTEVVIAGRSYWLYTHSFLQYGLQAAAQLYQKLAINDIEEHGNPCYPRSYRHSSVGDFDRCTSLLSSVVDKSVKCATSSCSFNGVYQPQIKSEQFLAIENFYYTAKFFGNADQQDQTTPGEKNAVQAAPTGNQVTSGLRAKGQSQRTHTHLGRSEWATARYVFALVSG